MKKEDAIRLAQLCQESFLNRRNYEWKVNFQLWTFIALWTYIAISNNSIGVAISDCLLLFVYSFIFLVYLIFWQIPLRQAFQTDKDWKHYYMRLAEGITKGRPTDSTPSICKWNQIAYLISQSIFTLILLIASWVLIRFI
jgi:hypothetical protein